MNTPQTHSPAKPEIAKVRYTHDAMIDLIISDPWISQNQIAAYFGYTVSWVSIIFSSDAFKERLEMRKEELVDPAIRATLEERMKALVTRSLDVLMEKLNKPASGVSDTVALRALELGAKAIGMGGNAPATPVTINAGHIENLAERLVQLRGQAYGAMKPLQPSPQLLGECNVEVIQ
jgi:hypothetical protein